MSAYDQASILINRCKRILALVDTYVDCPTQDHRTTLRKALLAEFDAAAIAPPVAADVETIQPARANFEDWYTGHAADIKAAPIGSRDSMLQWSSWIAARSGNYVARDGWKISPGPWGPAGAPVAAGSVDTLTRYKLEPDSYAGEDWMIEKVDPDGLWCKSADAIAWGAEQREQGKAEQTAFLKECLSRDTAEFNSKWTEQKERAEKAEAGLAEAQRQVAMYSICMNTAGVDALHSRANAAESRVKEMDAQLARRGAPLSPEIRQAIADARAASQTVAATPGGLVFMNDGAEPGSGELDCPACGGSGHAGDVPTGSAP